MASVLAEDDAPRAVVDLAEIYRRVSPSVVSIEVEIGLFDLASGTGFVVDEFGHILTNAHVVEDAYAIAVEFQDGLQTSAELIGMDTLVDIAVIKVDVRPYRLKPVTFGDSDDLDIGQSVLAIGNPFGLEATLTTGIISGLKRELEFDDGSVLEGMIQTDAAIAPGSSGGPLLTLYGEVIGVNSAGYGGRFGGTNFGFAIPSNTVHKIAENMIDSLLATRVAIAAREATLEAQKLTREAQRADAAATEIAEAALQATFEARITRTPPTPTSVLMSTTVPTPTATATLVQPTVAVRNDQLQPALTETVQPSPTRIVFETATATDTPTAPDTPLVSLPQVVEAASPTATSTDGLDFLTQDAPTFTPLPTLNLTEVARLLSTPPSRPTLPPTWTAVPTLPPTGTIAVPPEATAPVEISTPNDDRVFVSTPIVVTLQSQRDAPTLTPLPTATLVQPTVAVRNDLLQPAFQPQNTQPTTISMSGVSVFLYDVDIGQVFNFENIQLQGGVRLFLPNPVDPSSFLRTDQNGILRYKPIGVGQEGVMTYSPYFDGFASGIYSIDQNKNRIVELDWSADGRQFSFRIDPPQGTDSFNAGVWFWRPATNLETDPTYTIMRDCLPAWHEPCNMVYPSSARYWKTIGVQWSPINGNNTILLTIQLPEEGRNALAITHAVRDPRYADNAPPFVRYDYGTWDPNGQSITVSGRRPDGRVIIGVVNRELTGERIILDGSARGLWLRDAVRRPNGQYVALGRPGGPGSGPVALYDGSGNQISDFVGAAPPEEVRWFPDRSAVLVSVQGQQYTIDVESGNIRNYSDLTSNPQFSAGTFAVAPVPEGVIVNSGFSPGEQLRVGVPYLNIHQQPTSSSAVLGGLFSGDYVAIFAGPYENEGYRWWRIQTANSIFGWIAGTINGAPTIQRP